MLFFRLILLELKAIARKALIPIARKMRRQKAEFGIDTKEVIIEITEVNGVPTKKTLKF